jgi:hypothetical protein
MKLKRPGIYGLPVEENQCGLFSKKISVQLSLGVINQV